MTLEDGVKSLYLVIQISVGILSISGNSNITSMTREILNSSEFYTFRPTFVDLTHLVTQFVLTCGSTQGLCNPRTFPFNTKPSYLSDCPPVLDCNKNCAMLQTCPPDADNAYKKVFCLPTTIHTAEGTLQSSTGYYMVATCLKTKMVSQNSVKLCHQIEQIDESNFFQEIFKPVLSRRSNIVYRNKFCAACNDDDVDMVLFNLDMRCARFLDINAFSSMKDMWKAFNSLNCTVAYVPSAEMSPYVSSCSLSTEVITRCNASGLWSNYDPIIEHACATFNSMPYKGFRNIFCYICNPSIVSSLTKTIIDSCNVTGNWIQWQHDVERGCLNLPAVERTYPFKNIFCKMCNGYTYELRTYRHFEASVRDFYMTKGFISTVFYNFRFYSLALDIQNVSRISGTYNETSDADDNSSFSDALTELGKFCGLTNFCSEPCPSWTVPPYSLCSFRGRLNKNCCDQVTYGYNRSTLSPFDTCDNRRSRDLFTDLCENGSDTDPLYNLTVRSAATMLIYKNVYCARCNNDYAELYANRFTVSCPKPLEASLLLSFNDLLKIISNYGCVVNVQTLFSECSDEDTNCISVCKDREHWMNYNIQVFESCERDDLINSNFGHVYFNGTFYKNIFCLICNRNWVSSTEDTVSECNITGLWFRYDQTTETKCQNESAYPGWYPFKNIHCAYCNVGKSRTSGSALEIKTPMPQCFGFSCFLLNSPYRIAFSLSEIDFQREANENNPTEEFCTEGKVLHEGACHTIIEKTGNLGYNLSFGLIIKNASDKNWTDVGLQSLIYDIFDQEAALQYGTEILQLTVQTAANCNRAHRLINKTSESVGVKKMQMVSNETRDTHKLFAYGEHEFEDFETHINVVLFINKAINRTHVEEILHHLIRTTYIIPIQNKYLSCETYPLSEHTECDGLLAEDGNSCNHTHHSNAARPLDSSRHQYRFHMFNDSELQLAGVQFLTVNELLSCVLREKENKKGVIETLCLRGIAFELSADRTKIRLCKHDLEHLPLGKGLVNTDNFSLAYGIFSMVCTLLSLTCLCLTLLTYTLFKSLRSTPAINNMNLAVALFWAQLSLQFGLWQTADQNVCIFLGVFTHYFWLAAFCAMNVCSYHMFRVFHRPLLVSGDVNQRTVLFYSVYIYGGPLVAISFFLLTFSVTSNFKAVGYGGKMCFLSDYISILIMFIAPACVIILVNTIFFGIAYWHIHSSPRLQSTADRNELKIYLKLTTVTGMAWIFLFIDTLNPLSAFSFVAAIAGALQGVYIFVAFIFTSRVFSLYKSCFQRKTPQYEKPSKQSSSENSKTTKMSITWVQKQLDNSKETFI